MCDVCISCSAMCTDRVWIFPFITDEYLVVGLSNNKCSCKRGKLLDVCIVLCRGLSVGLVHAQIVRKSILVDGNPSTARSVVFILAARDQKYQGKSRDLNIQLQYWFTKLRTRTFFQCRPAHAMIAALWYKKATHSCVVMPNARRVGQRLSPRTSRITFRVHTLKSVKMQLHLIAS